MELLDNGICDELILDDDTCGYDANDCKYVVFAKQRCQQVADAVKQCENNELLRKNFPMCSHVIPVCTTIKTTSTTTTTTTTTLKTTTTSIKEVTTVYIETKIPTIKTTSTTTTTTTFSTTTTTTTTTVSTYGPPLTCPMLYAKLPKNGRCNDEANIKECDYDGGDCCSKDPHCKTLVGLENPVEVDGCVCKTNVSFTYESCNYTKWKHLVRDNVCHDITNNAECLYDGGDCCRPIAYRGLPGCIECQCKTGRVKPLNTLNINDTYRNYDPRWALASNWPKDQRLSVQQIPERRLKWIYKYEEYPELMDPYNDYEDKILRLKQSQFNQSRLTKPIAKAHSAAQVRRNINFF